MNHPDAERLAPWLNRPETHVAFACHVIRSITPPPLLLVALAFDRPQVIYYDEATTETDDLAELMRDETAESMMRETARYLPHHRRAYAV